MHLGRYEEALGDYIDLATYSESMPDLNLDWDCFYFNSGWLYAQAGKMEKSRQLFRKVDRKSQLQPDVKIWLDWLENDNQTAGGTFPIGKLPSFCKK